ARRRFGVCGVEKERRRAGSGVEAAACVAKERKPTNCRVRRPRREAKEGLLPLCRVEPWVASVRWRTYRLRVLHKRKADECKYDYNWWNDCFHIRGVSEKSRQLVEAIRPQAPIANSSSRNAASFSSACTTNRVP